MKKLVKGVLYLFVFTALYGFAKQGVTEISADVSTCYSGITDMFSSNEPETVEVTSTPEIVETEPVQ